LRGPARLVGRQARVATGDENDVTLDRRSFPGHVGSGCGVRSIRGLSSGKRSRIVRAAAQDTNTEPPTMNHYRPHIILMGGFLGAGKTAAMIALAH
jgi:hypothetical protein